MASEMQVIVCDRPGVLRRETRPIPSPGDGEALLKMHALGICGSDIHAFFGNQPMFAYPQVMGHEVSAEVVQVGSGVNDLKAGQSVVVIPYRHCGQCIACRRGRSTCCTNLSVMGVHRTGAMQEYIVIDAAFVIAVEDVTHADAALIEPYAISAHAVRRSGVQAGDWIMVAGAGAIGLGAADISRALGANVILADTNAARRAAARDLYGFSSVLDPLATDFPEKLQTMTMGDGPVVIIDATGNPASMNAQVERLAASGVLVFVGLHSDQVTFNDLAFHKRETTLHGSRAATREDFETVICLAGEKRIAPGRLCSRQVDFFDLDTALFSELTTPDLVKSVVVFK